MSRIPIARSTILGLALAATCATAAHGAAARYVVATFTQPADPGLAVSGKLGEQFRAVARARVVVPSDWQALASKPGQQRFLGTRSTNCRYRVAFTVTSRLGASADAAQVVAAALPVPSAPYLLDSGAHGSAAFRVVRRPSGGPVRVDALWTSIMTRRDDIAPAGQVAWSEIRVTATSGPRDECHAGTYREVLGPQLGDALAVARSRLTFVEPGSTAAQR